MFSENPDISSNLLYSLLPSSFVQFLSQGSISKLVHWPVNLKAWASHPKMASTINQPSAKASDLQVVGVVVWNQGFYWAQLLSHHIHLISATSVPVPFSPLSSFCLFPLPVISKPKSKNVSGSLSQITHVISTLLIFLNISILQKSVTNELYHKIPSDLKVFIWFPKQTAMLFQVNLLHEGNWFNKYSRKNKPGISKPGVRTMNLNGKGLRQVQGLVLIFLIWLKFVKILDFHTSNTH